MIEWPQPKNLRELRGFLGLTGYYRKFIANYAHIAHPFTEQLKKDNFSGTESAGEAFEHLKSVMTNPPVLKMPDFQQPFILKTDASGYGVGVVLMQTNIPVAYFSKLLGVKACQKLV